MDMVHVCAIVANTFKAQVVVDMFKKHWPHVQAGSTQCVPAEFIAVTVLNVWPAMVVQVM
jgi:hypothetical protein